jgi:hypothetical protein
MKNKKDQNITAPGELAVLLILAKIKKKQTLCFFFWKQHASAVHLLLPHRA